jgi:hypothetical protein
LAPPRYASEALSSAPKSDGRLSLRGRFAVEESSHFNLVCLAALPCLVTLGLLMLQGDWQVFKKPLCIKFRENEPNGPKLLTIRAEDFHGKNLVCLAAVFPVTPS